MADQPPPQQLSPLRHRTVSVSNGLVHAKQVKVVTLIDKRIAPPGAAQEWLFQADVESLLYPATAVDGTNGAFYRLLDRSDAGRGASLSLRRASVAANLVTDAEFEALKAMQHANVRVFTLVPVDAVGMALTTYGSTPTSEALLEALELPRPEEWPDPPADQAAQEGDAGEEGEEEGESEGGEQDSDDDDDEQDSSGGGGAGSAAAGGGSSSHSRSRDREEDDYPSTEEEPDPPRLGAAEDAGDADAPGANEAEDGKRKRVSFGVTPSMAREFASFQRFRTSEISRERNGRKVSPLTAADDQQRVLAFFAYLKAEMGVEVKSLGVLSSPKIGAAAQAYIKYKTMTREYSSVAKAVGSLIAAARFVLTTRKAHAASGAAVSTVALDELTALHRQCLSEGRLRDKFSTARPPKAWLDWADCQRARLSAEKAMLGDSGACPAMTLELTRDACLLKLLTAMPPDRVGVFRLLMMGKTLKQVDGDCFQIDLSEPGAHKTSAVFGPSCTTVTAGVAERIAQLIDADHLVAGEYLFHDNADRRLPLAPTAWTRLVKAAFLAHAGVALCPKDVRSSFITWMKDGDHGDAVCRSAAKAMKHSSTVADSASYDKHKSARVVEAAMKAADAFAKQFAIA